MESKVLIKILEWSLAGIVALVMALVIRYYVLAPTVVMQESMYPTLEPGQRIILSRLGRTSNIQYVRGDIVTFEAPIKLDNQTLTVAPVALYYSEPRNLWQNFEYNVLERNKNSYIKRIIGVGGDLIHIEENGIYINGSKLEEEYLQEYYDTDNIVFNNIVVPEGYVYVMGDNASKSLDSRYFGCIPLEKIEGRVIFRYWPYNLIGKIK